MSSSFVWVQLYYQGRNDPNGDAVEIESLPRNIGALVKQVKEVLKPKLDHAPVDEIFVYRPKIHSNRNRYKPGKPLAEVIDDLGDTTPPTSDDHPLIVVAPAPQQQLEYVPPTKKTKTEMDICTMAELVKLGTCYSLEQCPKPVYPFKTSPRFVCGENWLKDIRDVIQSNLDKDEDGGDGSGGKIPPLCLARCSWGGKTRSLYAIVDKSLKNNEGSIEDGNDNNNNEGGSFDFKSLIVSFNDSSSVSREEQDDPLAALTRRIAFAAYKGKKTTKTFNDKFRPMVVSDKSVREWLGETWCVLLIDELNQLENLVNPTAESKQSAEKFAEFLKVNFLQPIGRYFVFTTHEAFVTEKLSKLMDSKSDRSFVHRALPLIPSLVVAQRDFEWAALTAREAIYCGLIPGLIFARQNSTFPILKRKGAVEEFLDKNYSERTVFSLLKSLITGDEKSVPKSLQQLMDTIDEGKIRWIPDHMVYVLNQIAEHGHDKLSDGLQPLVWTIANLFDQFRSAKIRSGDGWEALFGLVLLVRILTKQSDDLIDLSPFLPDTEFKTSFNQTLNVSAENRYGDLKDVDALMDAIPKKLEGAHVAIYYPQHASFKQYDILVVMWDAAGNRFKTIGYQLKEGRETPSSEARSDFQNFVVKGKAPKKPKKQQNWEIASVDQIDNFFGCSGVHWTPKKWEELNESTHQLQKNSAIQLAKPELLG